MRHLPREDQFLLEALQRLLISSELWTDHFKGDHALQFEIAGFVHGTHAALAEHLDNLVTPG